jgi:hypothetical protein
MTKNIKLLTSLVLLSLILTPSDVVAPHCTCVTRCLPGQQATDQAGDLPHGAGNADLTQSPPEQVSMSPLKFSSTELLLEEVPPQFSEISTSESMPALEHPSTEPLETIPLRPSEISTYQDGQASYSPELSAAQSQCHQEDKPKNYDTSWLFTIF